MDDEALAELDGLVAEFAEALTQARVAAIITERAAPMLGAREAVLVLADGTILHAPESMDPRMVETMARDPGSPARVAMRGKTSVLLGEDAARERGWPAPTGCGWAFVPLVIRRRGIAALALALPPDCLRTIDEGAPALVVRQCALALDRSLLHQLEQHHQEQAEAEATRFRSLVQELDAVFWEGDPETFVFSFVSQRAEPLFGYPAQRWLEPGFWASIIHADDRSWAVDFCAACTRDGEDHVFEYRLVDAKGAVRWVRDVVYVVRDVAGRPQLLRGVMLDVTKDREAEETRRVPLAKRMPAAGTAPIR